MRMPMTDSYEYFAFTAKHAISFRSGQRKMTKRRFNRKERKWLNALLVENDYEKENKQ
jgi:hypothetical protein